MTISTYPGSIGGSSATGPAWAAVRTGPALLGVGTATPEESYTQAGLLELFGVRDERVRSVFLNSAIDRRHLSLPVGADGRPLAESQGELLARHRRQGVGMGVRALQNCLKRIGAAVDDLGYLVCVSTTGLLTPGFSALLIRELGIPTRCGRLDVVGMGCNAGLNALNAATGWATANPGEIAAVVCIEACSAAYVFDGTMRSSVVNSLFGDGAAAVAVRLGPGREGPQVLKYASRIIPDAIDAMRYEWDDAHGKFSFFLDRDVPYVVGAHAREVVGDLLRGTGLRPSRIEHWLIHSGGKKVIDSVAVNLGLTRHDVRHTTGVLRDYGNLSSGSFLFSYERLVTEGRARPGDYGVLMTMGPGSTLETALIRF
ncbi:3,5-dihydroxyphenylacetyl-CoA synthase DpgA [Actinocorallia aurantiaca]|uniref:3-oxoacyl-[acyl-carrier-protein] synthase III C-terminal domain-containing protein n=1 Tax=Actinocorallia aurantiaca TaxID=46204 RepID=A0ABN3U9E2_9ACTN